MQKKNQQGFRKESYRSVKNLIHGDWNQNLWTEPAASNRLSDGSMRHKYYTKHKLNDTPEVCIRKYTESYKKNYLSSPVELPATFIL